jgi:hypothetical protein
MAQPIPAPAEFVAAYDADPLLLTVSDAQILAWLGERARWEWCLRDEASKRTWKVPTQRTLRVRRPDGSAAEALRIECRRDDEVHHLVTGPHSGREYQVVRYRNDWCGETTDCYTYYSRRPDGFLGGPSLGYLANRHATPEAAEKVALAEDLVVAASGGPLDRAGYEAACARLGVAALPDTGCDSYGVRYGDFDPFTYTVEVRAEMALASRRLGAIEAEREAAKAALPPAPEPVPVPRKWGAGGVRYDEHCARCHKVADVDNDTDLCRRCGA